MIAAANKPAIKVLSFMVHALASAVRTAPNAVNQPEHLWVLVAQLRKKMERDPSHPRYLLTEPWVGYRLASES